MLNKSLIQLSVDGLGLCSLPVVYSVHKLWWGNEGDVDFLHVKLFVLYISSSFTLIFLFHLVLHLSYVKLNFNSICEC